MSEGNGHDKEGAERPCGCDQRRVRVVFPSGQSRLIWKAVTAGIALWLAWITTRIETRMTGKPDPRQDNLICQCVMEKTK